MELILIIRYSLVPFSSFYHYISDCDKFLIVRLRDSDSDANSGLSWNPVALQCCHLANNSKV